MAEAAAIALPPGLTVEDMKLEKGPYKLSLNLKAKVEKGKTYTFTKYIAMARQNWGGDAKATLDLAKAARAKGFDQLLAAPRPPATSYGSQKSSLKAMRTCRRRSIPISTICSRILRLGPPGRWAPVR
jgi:hypothetical protein